MSTRRILDVVRALFLAASAACAAAAYIWSQHPSLVERVDTHLVRRYVHDAQRDLQRAKNLAAAGRRADAIATLEARVPELRSAQRGDRLERSRIEALGLLADLLAEEGRNELALSYAEELFAHDERDLLNALCRARLLGLLGRHQEALAVLEGAARIGGTTPRIARPYLEALTRAGDADRALQVILGLGERGPLGLGPGTWEAFLSPGQGPPQRARAKLDISDAGALGWTLAVEAGPTPLSKVRLDLPVGAHLDLEDLNVRLSHADGGDTTLGMGEVARLANVERIGDRLRYGGGADPFLVLEVPEAARTRPVTEVRIIAQVRTSLDVATRKLLRDAAQGADRSALIAEFGEPMVTRLEAALR